MIPPEVPRGPSFASTLLKRPAFTGFYVMSRLHPQSLFRRYDALARQAGIDRLYLVLSFDCDTEADIAVVADVHARLADLGVTPVYAVPAELVRKGLAVYGKLRESGAEFINHGYREHAAWNRATGEVTSTFFYDQETRAVVTEDIVKGHEALKELLGVTATGFRTPHFGSFQTAEQLGFLHQTLRGLGYRFSTSTMPYFGFRHGPAFKRFGLLELPVSGTLARPLNVLDSWGFFQAPTRTVGESDYYREGCQIAEMFQREKRVGILNYYVDPSHIAKSDAFFETVKQWASVAQPTSYGALLETLGHV